MRPIHRGLAIAGMSLVIVVVESRLLVRRGFQLDAARAAAGKMGAQIRRLQGDQSDYTAQLGAATGELARLQADVTAAETGEEGELRSWARRINRIKSLFSDRPELAIPELGLLTASDWLQIARDADLDTDDGRRKALASARTAAKVKFGQQLSAALRKYRQANDGSLPEATIDLQPYFDSTVDAAILPRYRMALTGAVSDAEKGTYALTEIAPVDEAYDVRWDFIASGGSRIMPWGMSEWFEAQDAAKVAYARANQGRLASAPDDLSALLPYVQSPEVRAIMQGMAGYEAAHGGRPTSDAAELMPYLSDPGAKALAEKFWPKKLTRNRPIASELAPDLDSAELRDFGEQVAQGTMNFDPLPRARIGRSPPIPIAAGVEKGGQ